MEGNSIEYRFAFGVCEGDVFKDHVTDELFGIQVSDPYRWLEDGRSEEVRAWTARQDALARAYLSKLPDRDPIAARLRELFYVESMGVPRHLGRVQRRQKSVEAKAAASAPKVIPEKPPEA